VRLGVQNKGVQLLLDAIVDFLPSPSTFRPWRAISLFKENDRVEWKPTTRTCSPRSQSRSCPTRTSDG
jgi:translation elongation factor EF-G